MSDNVPILVGGASDGAAVNITEDNGLRGMLQDALRRIHYITCTRHVATDSHYFSMCRATWNRKKILFHA